MSTPRPDDHLLDLAHRLLAGESIDWDKEGIAESEVHYQRAIRLRDESPDDKALAQSLEYYASLLRAMRRSKEAEEADARARALRAKLETTAQELLAVGSE